jgi:hypothetical protein
MNTQDIGRGTLIAAASAIALLIFMFFAWYGVDSITASGGGFEQEITGDQIDQLGGGVDTSASAWKAFSLIDILLLITILGVVGLAVARAMGATLNLPIAPSALIAGLGGIAFLLILFRLLVAPDAVGDAPLPEGVEVEADLSRKIGIFLGLLAAAGMAIGGWLAMQEEGATFGEQRDRLAGGPGAGPGAAAPPPGPGAGQEPPPGRGAGPEPPPPPPPAAGGGTEPPPPPPPPR